MIANYEIRSNIKLDFSDDSFSLKMELGDSEWTETTDKADFYEWIKDDPSYFQRNKNK